eukprot:7359976-Pyramimonas_sp.AAC.1
MIPTWARGPRGPMYETGLDLNVVFVISWAVFVSMSFCGKRIEGRTRENENTSKTNNTGPRERAQLFGKPLLAS